MTEGKNRQNRCPALKTLDSSLNESGRAFGFELNFFLLPFFFFSFLCCRMVMHSTSQGDCCKYQDLFLSLDQIKTLNFSLGLYIAQNVLFCFLVLVILRTDW